MCGFSRASIQILGLQGVDPNKFSAFNVLEDEELRQGKYLQSSFLKDTALSLQISRLEGLFRLAYDTPALCWK